ncbi:MAG: hypothetical protein KM296_00175 [Brockia lithotrophica]|nr:hypothetical protein [Brockia lithotrophica]
MRVLSIDLETFSPVEIEEKGAYEYAKHAEILLFAYAYDDDPVEVIRVAEGEKIPGEILADLRNPEVTKTAWNVSFEYNVIERALKISMDYSQWEDTMLLAGACGLPLALDAAGQTLGLPIQKLASGTRLINTFSKPDGKGKRTFWHEKPAEWEEFVAYNKRDVEVEREIRRILKQACDIPETERKLMKIDFEINQRGALVDIPFVERMIKILRTTEEDYIGYLGALLEVKNPRSVAQLAEVFRKNGFPVETFNANEIPEVKKRLLESDLPEETKNLLLHALEIREYLAKSSVKKYIALQKSTSPEDGRIRGILQMYGAPRTGRWAGRRFQPQNLPRPEYPDTETLRTIFTYPDEKVAAILPILTETKYLEINQIASDLIRTTIVAPEGKMLAVADFSSIESRVLAWIAGEGWKLDVFRTTGKIYEAVAAQMFGVPAESIDKSSPLRQKGKVAELALGYQGGLGALTRMGGSALGLSESEMIEIVQKWRNANPEIVNFWKDIEDAAKKAIAEKTAVTVKKLLVYYDEKGFPAMKIKLPSGRSLVYPFAKIDESTGQIVFRRKKEDTEATYGGKLTENIVQATARDLLAHALIQLSGLGFQIIFHVHDEIVAEVDAENAEEWLQNMLQVMKTPPSWAQDLPLGAEGFVSKFYKKD